MANWVTHMMIADAVLERLPWLDRRGFCIGCIAPDCNVENEDWTSFTPPREVTHWMQGEKKNAADCDVFYREYLIRRAGEIHTEEQRSFLLGYYAHLIADAEMQRFVCDEERVCAVWQRILADERFRGARDGLPLTWEAAKRLIPRSERQRDIACIEAEYLEQHPDSAFMTEVLPLRDFPDYIDYLPAGSIVRKIGVMGGMPEKNEEFCSFTAISRDEYTAYVANAIEKTIAALEK